MSSPRSILITGCSDGGLGSGLAIAFHNAGWRVFASARDTSKMQVVAAKGIETVQLDVTDPESIASCVGHIESLTPDGSLDALVNNAGAVYRMPVLDLDMAKTRQMFDLTLFAIIATTQAFFPLLLRAAQSPRSDGKKPLIVNNTSVASLIPAGSVPWASAYNASKAAAASLTETMRYELAPLGVTVVNLVTGVVQSNIFDNAVAAAAASEGVKLPRSSVYYDTSAEARAAIELSMSGADVMATSIDTATWAARIVRDVDKARPAHWVWRGFGVWTGWLLMLLPVGSYDWLMKRSFGIDMLERAIKEKGGVSKLKLS